MRSDVLIVEISGKRPGTKKDRPTEKMMTKYPHVIISNNADGYITDWPIVIVPEEYKQWYIENAKQSENMWYAQMNRSYAIKYARENGYKYLVQLDDNILQLDISYIIKKDDYNKEYRRSIGVGTSEDALDDFIDLLLCVLDNTNAGMAGFNLCSTVPTDEIIKERYVYSFFALKLGVIPDYFHGDFEDDIEFRLKLKQMNIPVLQVEFMRYGKVGADQGKTGDLTGCRAEYAKAGIKRGEHMRKLYGETYSCGTKNRSNTTNGRKIGVYFKHHIKGFQVGCCVKDHEEILDKIRYILKKYANIPKQSIKWNETKVKE